MDQIDGVLYPSEKQGNNVSTILYHNPRCSKSRATLALLSEKKIDFKIKEYLKNEMKVSEINNLLEKLGLGPRDLLRKGESVYKELKLDDPNLTEQALVQAMVDHPILMERPILITEKGARIGRPPEQVLEIV